VEDDGIEDDYYDMSDINYDYLNEDETENDQENWETNRKVLMIGDTIGTKTHS
jgi:hypothetical protein